MEFGLQNSVSQAVIGTLIKVSCAKSFFNRHKTLSIQYDKVIQKGHPSAWG
jgi:hypothetical protein